jgi:hypothetical protein
MTANVTTQPGGAASASRAGFRFRRRHLWWIPGLAVAILASQISERSGLGIVPMIVFQMAPHLATFGGARARRLFNFGHHPLPPAVLTAIAVAGALTVSLPPIWMVAGLAWLSHVVIGWGIGDGQRPAGGGQPAGDSSR